MNLRNLSRENPNHYEDRQHILWATISSKKVDAIGQDDPIVDSLKKGTLKMSEWVRLDHKMLQEIISTFSSEERDVAKRRFEVLYDLWLEYFVQERLMRKLLRVHYYAPHRVPEYAGILLAELGGELEKGARSYPNYRLENGLSPDANFAELLRSLASSSYQSNTNIHDPAFYHQAEAIARYKSYLEKILKEGIETNPSEPAVPISLEGLCPELVALSKQIVVKYTSKKHYYKEDSFIDYNISSVCGCYSAWSLRNEVKSLFEAGYDRLLTIIRTLPEAEQTAILRSIYEEAEELRYIVTDGSFEEGESENGPAKTYNFKRFEHLIYFGDNDIRFAENEHSRKYLDKKLSDFADAWLEAVSGILRKIEHALDNLHLLRHSPSAPKFDTTELFKNVFVVEGKESGIQGTAFYLSGVGIVTCDHCIRSPDTGSPFDEIEIYRGAELKKIPVKIVKMDKDYDIAILEPIGGYTDFFQGGLKEGNADSLKHLDPIAVAGFPNYNPGDQGYLRRGEITGFRKIHSVPHVMVSAALVGGNSGGPVMNMEGEVLGIVVTGSDNFAESDETERHGFLPISLIKYL